MTKKPKKDLKRLVVSDGEVVWDLESRLPGRGAYLCSDPDCLEIAVKRDKFARAFKQPVSVEKLVSE